MVSSSPSAAPCSAPCASTERSSPRNFPVRSAPSSSDGLERVDAVSSAPPSKLARPSQRLQGHWCLLASPKFSKLGGRRLSCAELVRQTPARGASYTVLNGCLD